MFANFRQSMSWVHTWFGLVFGFILMAVFFFGALSVFDREIDRWAIPETRFHPQPMPSFDTMLLPILRQVEPDPAAYAADMPRLHDPAQGAMTPRLDLPVAEFWAYTTHRDPVLRMGADFEVPHPKDPHAHNHIHGGVTIDPRSGERLSDRQHKIGSDFFYPMHYDLHLNWRGIGWRLVGFSALIMLAALVSGVVIHRKLFREFFTFRPWKHSQRRALDLHNMSGVVALPFHFFFAFTGILIFGIFHLPVDQSTLQSLHQQHEELESQITGLPLHPAGVFMPMASIDAMVAEAKRRWAQRDMPGEVGFLTVTHVDDLNGYVSIFRAGSDRVALVGEGIHFKASNGEVLREDPPRSVVESANEFLIGLHLQHFEHWPLRWLYVFAGLLGCVCLATGFIFFVEKRKQKHAEQGVIGSRLVDAFAVAAVSGMLIATLSLLIANRLLPQQMADRALVESNIFWLMWAASLVHGLLRNAGGKVLQHNRAWGEQCWAIGGLGIIAVLANWFTTGDHLIKTLFTDTYWPVAGVDLSLLVLSVVAWRVAKSLSSFQVSPAKDELDAKNVAYLP